MSQSIVVQKSKSFAILILILSRRLNDRRDYVISNQLLRSGTSIGANIAEAQCAQSRKDFLAKMYIAFKEASETKYWLEIMLTSKLYEEHTYDLKQLLDNIGEIIRLLSSSTKTTKDRLKNN